jgi:hypothetical protein
MLDLVSPMVHFSVRGVHTSLASFADVVVPAMGDSITEGSIAAVLKQPGELGWHHCRITTVSLQETHFTN